MARDSVVLLSSIVAFELWYGVAKSQRKDSNRQRLEAFFAGPLEWTLFEPSPRRLARLNGPSYSFIVAGLLLALPLRATVAPDLADLTRQIESFPQSAAGSEGERLAKFFDLYWAASMREAPDFAAYIGYAGLRHQP